MRSDVWGEIAVAYVERLGEVWPQMIGLASFALFAGFVAKRLGALEAPGAKRALRIVTALALPVSIAVGVALCVSRASAFDDAYISFRYAQNLVDGHGLVWNPGERVEGYTNFLWTVLIAIAIAVSRLEAPLVGLGLALLCFVANLVVVAKLSRRLSPLAGPVFPIAALMLAVQDTFVSYGTSGLETMFASLLVNLGILALCSGPAPRARALAGLWLILATLTRPDHALFYATGALVVAFETLLSVMQQERELGARVRAAWRPLLAYAAPTALYLAHLGFRYAYYGDVWPNTYYAKVASDANYSQGLVYAADFYLPSHLWLVAPLWLAYIVAGPRSARSFRVFSLLSVVVYNVYVARVGGDFMHGRFYLTLLPMIVVGVEQLVLSLWVARPWPALVALSMLAATAGGVRLQEPGKVRWYIADESSFYRVTSFFPVVVDHYNYNVGQLLRRLREAGVRPKIATTSVGMVGYYSQLPVIDEFGLTDRVIARLPTIGRSRPGHERRDSRDYLIAQHVDIARRVPPPKPYRNLARLWLGPDTGGRHWYLLRYDAQLVARMRSAAPELRVADFPRYLDQYLQRAALDRPARGKLEADARFFGEYYFSANDDPARKAALDQLLAQARAR